MDKERMERMANKIAEENDENLVIVDQAVDSIIAAIQTLDETLPNVDADNDEQKNAIVKIQELLDTAIVPYMGDIVKELDVFEAQED